MTTEPTAVPGVQKQLTGAPSGPYDCVIRGGVDWPVTWSTGKAITPTDPMEIRERMGISKPNVGATIDQAKVGYESYQGKAAKLGYDLPNLNVRDEGKQSTTRNADGVAQALSAGHAVVAFVWYGKVNSLIPWASGDPSFSGGHCWTLYRYRDGEMGRETQVYDPLHDGKAGRPGGPIWVEVDDVLACMAAFRKGGVPGNDPLGTGKAIFGIAKRAKVIASQPPANDLDRAYEALYAIRDLGLEIDWPRLTEMAEDGLPDEGPVATQAGALDDQEGPDDE